MKLEDIKSYKDACKVIDRRPRKYKDIHLNTYEQLSTITQAINYIESGKMWKNIIEKNKYFFEIYYVKRYNNASIISELCLDSHCELNCAYICAGNYLLFTTRQGAEYAQNMFKSLLQKWFDPMD